MEEEARRTLHKFMKEHPANTTQPFKVYCFPDLAECGVGSFVENERAFTFQRIEQAGGERNEPNRFSRSRLGQGSSKTDPNGASGLDVEAIEKEAYFRGYAEGERVGVEKGCRQVTPAIDNFGQALVELERIKKGLLLNVEENTLQLAMAIAKKIVSHEVLSDRRKILNVIRGALQQVVDPEGIVIRLHPDDFKFVTEAGPSLHSEIDHYEHITFQADPTVTGGCLVETRMGEIDARFDRQFQVIEALFEAEFDNTRKDQG